MTPPIAIGDKVRCIRAGTRRSGVRVGEIYQVEWISALGGLVRLAGKRHVEAIDCFELEERAPEGVEHVRSRCGDLKARAKQPRPHAGGNAG